MPNNHERIVLINPPLTGEERYGALAKGGVYFPNLGLGYLTAVLRKEGYHATIFDCAALNLDRRAAAERILGESPSYVGITAVTPAIHNAAGLAELLKELKPELKVLLGGPHITAAPEETMLKFGQFDVGVIGEGEVSIVDLMDALRNARDLAAVDGLIYKQNGKLIKTKPRELIKDLDILPYPAWELFPDLARYYKPAVFAFKKLPSINLITSRGCPSRCSFCNNSPWGRTYREHSAEYMMEDIRRLYHEYKIRDIAFYDGTFGINRERLIKLCELLIKEKWGLVWSCNLRVNMADPQMLKLMKRAGCWMIAYGIESGSEKILNFIQKGVNKEQILQAITNTKKAGIISKGYIMIGTLLETRETFEETLDYVLGLDLNLLTVNHFTPYPGTLDYQRAEYYGSIDKDWRFLNQHSLVFVPKTLTREEVESFITRITKRFYLRPKIILNFLKLSLRPGHLKLLFEGSFAFVAFILRGRRESTGRRFLKIPRGKVYFSRRAFIKGLSLVIRGALLEGRQVEEFERRFAEYLGVKHAISMYSGTLSLCLCLEAQQIKTGDEIIVPGYIVPEVVEAIKGYGAVPVFADIDPDTYNISPPAITEKISNKTRIILMAHMYGQPCDVGAILDIARRHNLKVIEDCAQACGAEYKGRKVGNFGQVAYFSFGVMKNMNTLGGGMIVTNNDGLARQIRDKTSNYPYPRRIRVLKKYISTSLLALLSNRVAFTLFVYPFLRFFSLFRGNFIYSLLPGDKKTDIDMKGISLEKYRRRYTNLQAAIGLEQLKSLEENNEMRIKNARILSDFLKNNGFTYPKTIPAVKNIFLNYVIQAKNREELNRQLLKKGIDTTSGYIQYFGDTRFSRQLFENNIYLPIFPPLRDKDVAYIEKALSDIQKNPSLNK